MLQISTALTATRQGRQVFTNHHPSTDTTTQAKGSSIVDKQQNDSELELLNPC
jgi:hypothetical protein